MDGFILGVGVDGNSARGEPKKEMIEEQKALADPEQQKEADAKRRNAQNWGGVLCALLTALCVAAIHPSLEMGVLDDFSYTKTVFDLARTGHVIYNGWATAMLGWQLFWGALFVKLFGYSYLTVRLSTLPIAMGCAYLLFWLAARFGLNFANALLATCTVVLSPVFLPLAASFMTDVSGLFCIFLCLVCCLKALDAQSSRAVLGWLALATVDGILGGTSRQIAWVAPLVVIPSTGWLLRKVPGVVAGTVVLCLGTIAAILGCLSWFQHQPDSLPEKVLSAPLNVATAVLTLQQYRDIALTILLLALPCLAAFLATLRTVPKKVFFALLALAMLLVAARLHSRGVPGMAPWLNHIATAWGVGGSGFWEGTGEKPLALTGGVRVVLTFLFTIPLCAFVAKLLFGGGGASHGRFRRGTLPWHTIFILLVPFTMCYLVLLAPRAMVGAAFDRYLLPVFALWLLPLLRLYQQEAGDHVPKLAFAVLALFSGYAVAATHDYFVMQRARLDAAEEIVEEKHVARTAIQGGWEYDGETQINEAGYINDPRLKENPHSYKDVNPVSMLPENCRFYFAAKTPVIQPRYFVVFLPTPCLEESDLPPVPYSIWLPPFRGQIEIEELPHS